MSPSTSFYIPLIIPYIYIILDNDEINISFLPYFYRSISHIYINNIIWPYQARSAVGRAQGLVSQGSGFDPTFSTKHVTRRSTALSRWRYKIAPRREAAAPGRPLWRLARDGRGDSRVGDVVVFGAHCPCLDDGPRRCLSPAVGGLK
jgi:hypothetical protein